MKELIAHLWFIGSAIFFASVSVTPPAQNFYSPENGTDFYVDESGGNMYVTE